MKKCLLAVVAFVVMLAANVDAQPRGSYDKQARSAEEIARARSLKQSEVMHLNQTQRKKLYELNLCEARRMNKLAAKQHKASEQYRAKLRRIVGDENMKIYDAMRWRNRAELQRGPKDFRKHEGRKPAHMVPSCPHKGPQCGKPCPPKAPVCNQGCFAGKPACHKPCKVAPRCRK